MARPLWDDSRIALRMTIHSLRRSDLSATSCDNATARYNVRVMPRIPFDQLPSDARLWIFAAERPLAAAESARVLEETDSFINQWMAHGVPLTAGRDLRHDQFVLVGVDERAAGVSGCSIDALVRRMQQLESVLGLELVNNAPGAVSRRRCHRARVARSIRRAGRVGHRRPEHARLRQHAVARRRSACREVGSEGCGDLARTGVFLTLH